jgi:hypothetical protein
MKRFEDPTTDDRDGAVFVLAYFFAAVCACVIAAVLGLLCLGVFNLIVK